MVSSINLAPIKKDTDSVARKKPADQVSASNSSLPRLAAAIAPASSPRLPLITGFNNIAMNAVQGRQITFFASGQPIGRELQQQSTAAVLLHLQNRFAQTPSPTIILGAQYMNARGVQLAHYLKNQLGLAVYVDGFAILTQFYQRNHGGFKQLALPLTKKIANDQPLIYFGETHMVHKMVAPPNHLLQSVEQAWQDGRLTLIGEQHAVLSEQKQTFSSSAQQVVDALLKDCQPVLSVAVQEITAHQTKQLFQAITYGINQARDWPAAIAAIVVLLNHLPTPHGSAVFDVGSESFSLLNKLCELNAAPDFSASALRSLLQGAIGDALSNLKELVNYSHERDAMHTILPVAVMGDTAFVNGGGQHMMLKFAEHMQKAFVTVIVLNNHQQKIENSLAAAPVKGHHNGQHITQGSCVSRVDNLTDLKQVLLQYVAKIGEVISGKTVQNMLIDVDLTERSQLRSLAKPITLLQANADRLAHLTHLIDQVLVGFKQQKLHGYACSFFELVHEITKVESAIPEFHYHATLTDQGVFSALAFHATTAWEHVHPSTAVPIQPTTAPIQRYARLIFMNSCFPVRLVDQLPQILNAPVSPLLPIFVVADTPSQANSPYAMGLPHREFLTTTVPIEGVFQAASKVEGDIQFLNTMAADWVSSFALALQDPQIKMLVVRF